MFVMELDARRTRTLTLRVPAGVNEMLEKAYRDLGYSTKSDFIREAVMEYINEVLKKAPANLSVKDERVRVGGKPKSMIGRNTRLVVVR